MRDLWPPKFQSHDGWDPEFQGIGYPEYAKHAQFQENPSDDSLENRRNSKSVSTLGSRVYHISSLLDPSKFQKQQAEETTLPTSSGSTQVREHQQSFSLPLSSSSQIPKQSKPVAGGFKAPVRVKKPVHLEDKRSFADSQHSQESKPVKPKPDPQAQINVILSKMAELQSKVEQFTGTSSDEKDYRFLDEMLTRLLLRLDDVETDNHPSLRQERKKAVKDVQACIALLVSRLAQNQAEQTDGSQAHSI